MFGESGCERSWLFLGSCFSIPELEFQRVDGPSGDPSTVIAFVVGAVEEVSFLAVPWASLVQASQVNFRLEGVEAFFKMFFEEVGSEILVGLEQNIEGGFEVALVGVQFGQSGGEQGKALFSDGMIPNLVEII